MDQRGEIYTKYEKIPCTLALRTTKFWKAVIYHKAEQALEMILDGVGMRKVVELNCL